MMMLGIASICCELTSGSRVDGLSGVDLEGVKVASHCFGREACSNVLCYEVYNKAKEVCTVVVRIGKRGKKKIEQHRLLGGRQEGELCAEKKKKKKAATAGNTGRSGRGPGRRAECGGTERGGGRHRLLQEWMARARRRPRLNTGAARHPRHGRSVRGRMGQGGQSTPFRPLDRTSA